MQHVLAFNNFRYASKKMPVQAGSKPDTVVNNNAEYCSVVKTSLNQQKVPYTCSTAYTAHS